MTAKIPNSSKYSYGKNVIAGVVKKGLNPATQSVKVVPKPTPAPPAKTK